MNKSMELHARHKPGVAAPSRTRRRGRFGSVEALACALVAFIVGRFTLVDLIDGQALRTWTTVFVSIVVQATPFLVLGVVISAAIAVFVPPSFFARAMPKRPVLAVPVAAASGVLLPGCECGSVPIAGAPTRRGVPAAAALAFLLAAPAVNPIVLVATAIAFPNDPRMVFARAIASMIAAVTMGWLWLRLGRADWIRLPDRSDVDGLPRAQAFWASCRHDLIHAGGFLVVGGLTAATLNVVVPGNWLQVLADSPVLSVLALAGLAVLLSICSEADAFVAASLTSFSPTAKLAFLVVGPMIDVKLFAMQAGTFGSRFAVRFGPATFVVAVAAAVGVGAVMW